MNKFFAIFIFGFALLSNLFAVDAPSTIEMVPDHCIGLIWSSGGSFNLGALIGSGANEIKDKIYFKANGELCENKVLKFDNFKPGSLKPDIYYVTMHYPNIDRPLDALWVVVNSPAALTKFNAWVSENTNTSWIANLPKPFASITIQNGSPVDPEPPTATNGIGQWDAPHAINRSSYLHHNAVWEMRTTLPGSCGNQATYDENGNLIRSTIAAGTADKNAPYDETGSARKNFKHVNADVHPYIRALQLDGNPVRITGMSVNFPFGISRPCLVQGNFTETYLRLRPIILP